MTNAAIKNDYSHIDNLINSLGLTYSAEFVPQSKSRNAGEKRPSLNWKVTVSRGLHTFTTDYMQGIGHAPKDGFYAKNPTLHNKIIMEKELKMMTEGGSYRRGDSQLIGGKIPAPLCRDVLYSLILDSDVLNHANFESWASDFGYDTDSRKAEETYKACLDIALQLKVILGGEANMEKLREAFQDY